MAGNTNRLSRFWKELKRRKVTRVITVYAAAAFVVLELTDIVAPSLGLPDWTLNFIIILLCVGFIIAVILSWIYDIHPEEGVVKTEAADKVKVEDSLKSSNSWKIASYVSFVVIVGLIVLNIIPRTGKKKILDKSIAVLPFTNMSTDEENTYFIDGVMESILDNLCKIKDLRVPGRTSVIQYRDNPKPISIVAEEMDVAYVLEGSGQKIGNRLLLTVQLIIGNEDRHIWSKQYDRVIEKVEDLIDIQKEIAQLVANEIEVIITPEEEQRIERVPTTSLTALDFYQRGREEYNNNKFKRAEDLYREALEYDSTFAEAYSSLAWVYWYKHYIDTYFDEDFMDSVLVMTDIALSYDDKLAEAYAIRGRYYNQTGNPDQALKEFDKAIELNPNDWYSYKIKGDLYLSKDAVEAINNRQIAVSLNRGPQLPGLLRNLGYAYNAFGFTEKAAQYYEDAFRIGRDSIDHFSSLFLEGTMSHLENINFCKRIYAYDSTNIYALQLIGYIYTFLDQYEEALAYFQKYIEKGKVQNVVGLLAFSHRIGYVYCQNGYKEEAEHYFDQQLDYCNRVIELGRSWDPYYDLAAVYAFRGEKGKAYKNLRIYNQKKLHTRWVVELITEDDPLFDSIRDEPDFQQIVRDVEAKYQAEHKRVRQWLEENDML